MVTYIPHGCWVFFFLKNGMFIRTVSLRQSPPRKGGRTSAMADWTICHDEQSNNCFAIIARFKA